MGERLRRVLKPLASLRLTVALLAMLMFLIFAGTWAQIDMGIWSALKTYFRTFIVWIPFQLFLPRHLDVPGGFPFPGGYVLGGLLMVNLLTAHAVRFKLRARRAGILLIHLGLILLLLGELVSALFAEESNMSIDEGQTVSFAEDGREVEFAIIDPSDPQEDWVVVVPQSMLEKGGLIQHSLLPFDIRIEQWLSNADLFDVGEVEPVALARANRGTAAQFGLVARAKPVVSGVDQNEIDLPVAVATVIHEGRELGTWMAALYFTLVPRFATQEVPVNGKVYNIALRYKRIYKPYAIQLLDFRHDRYLGTNTPKNFSSQIRLIDPSR
ncbi:MAG: cytochrome c biogenesis protein ResB, partial [Candidatus Krumholzibacteriia bacterium]